MTNDDIPGKEKVTGWLDVPLNTAGRENARKLGRFLKTKGITKIISSDTKRALQTAEIISEMLGVGVTKTDKLRSWHMGSVEGMDGKAAKPFLGFFEENPDVPPPGGEKFWAFYRRFKAAVMAIFRFAKAFKDGKIFVMTHSQDLDILKWIRDSVEPGNALEFGEGIAPGGCLEVRVADDLSFTMRKVYGV